jgi:hypothetical protein
LALLLSIETTEASEYRCSRRHVVAWRTYKYKNGPWNYGGQDIEHSDDVEEAADGPENSADAEEKKDDRGLAERKNGDTE